MKTLNPNNRNPKSGIEFWTVHKLLMEEGRGVASLSSKVGVGNNTIARFRMVGHDDPQGIEVKYYHTVVAVIWDNDSVTLDPVYKVESGNYRSKATKTRMDWCLLPIGFRMVTVVRTWKVYSINTGAYRDYRPGMTVTKGDF